MIKTITKAVDVVPDNFMSPTATSLYATQQRCIILLKALDAKKVEIDSTKTYNSPHFYSDAFLSEVSNFMFQMNSSLTVILNNIYLINRHRLTNIYIFLVG